MAEVFHYFLRLGFLGFGGPLAIIATMQKDLVEKRRWVSQEDFTKAFAIIKVMPGPVAYQMVIFLAQQRRGRLAGLMAALLYVFPSFIMMLALAWGENRLTDSPWVPKLLLGFQASALGLVLWSLKSLAKPYQKEISFWCIAALGGLTYILLSPPEPLLIISGACTALAYRHVRNSMGRTNELASLFFVCLLAGALVFGTGLAIVPMLESDFVGRYHWVSYSQFMNAVAFGQITPGPVVIAVTYLGFLAHGFWGAVVATLGIFLACSFHMLTWFPYLIKRMGRELWLQDFATGAVACVLSTLLFFCFKQGMTMPPKLYFIVLLSLCSMAFLRIPAWVLLPGMGLLGLLLA